ncbi:MAG: ATP-dependent zinc metalloprotease FtsH, partial [Muribaculum sp.]|nr:ATP-dependent zinc metalloprotease FtsH [Muribaculum sp.]
NPKRYTDLGGKIPKGALLVGPPGTGKTLLAKAVAGEANVPFFSMSGSDFVEMFVGVGASRVRDLFRQAKEKAPCIVFIDEIDAVGRARGRNPNMGSNDERENTLNQLLTEMDGFGSNSGVIILAATNRADILDKALMRAGRFDRQIYVDLPDLNDRIAIFNVHLRKIKTDDSLDVETLARQTPGFSGADIANVCNEAALIAARHNKDCVQKQDFNDAVDRIIGGLEKKTKITTAEEKHAIAVHEAGHATISWHLRYASPLIKVTIVPRGKALGAAWYMPEERQITPSEALLDEMCSTLGGRAAEELFLGHISTGAANDLERVTKLAYAMVAYYGMSDKLPNLCYYDSTGQEYGFSKPYSDQRAREIDAEVSRIINEQYQRAKDILMQHADGHKELAQTLINREVIFTEDVERIFGPRPWVSRTDEIFAHIKEQQQIAGSDSGALPPAIPENESPEDVEAEEVVDSDSTDN